MSHPYHHAVSSAKLFGGVPEDYQKIHDWFDATKELFPDARHRALRHHTHGIFEAERVFGVTITNASGREVPVRLIGEQHCKEDCGGRVPTVEDWLSAMTVEPWMHRAVQDHRRQTFPEDLLPPSARGKRKEHHDRTSH